MFRPPLPPPHTQISTAHRAAKATILRVHVPLLQYHRYYSTINSNTKAPLRALRGLLLFRDPPTSSFLVFMHTTPVLSQNTNKQIKKAPTSSFPGYCTALPKRRVKQTHQPPASVYTPLLLLFFVCLFFFLCFFFGGEEVLLLRPLVVHTSRTVPKHQKTRKTNKKKHSNRKRCNGRSPCRRSRSRTPPPPAAACLMYKHHNTIPTQHGPTPQAPKLKPTVCTGVSTGLYSL